ncbi:MAG: YfhO family protein [Candidatus Omnitrophica bacterium]|nr:YfhO family protein [Candidatus Omnitrophota bacterium]
MRDFVFGIIPVNMDTHTTYGAAKFYFNNILNGVVPLWDPFVSLGRNFYLMDICNLFVPVTQVIGFLKLAGVNYANAFVAYLVVYFFIGCAGFYFLAKEILKNRSMAYLAYVALMFSSLGASMFTQTKLVELVVPAIWFFFFLIRFARQKNRGHFLGIAFTGMVLINSYLPFYFLTVGMVFTIVFVILYPSHARDFCINFYRFLSKHWLLALMCIVGLILAAAPLLAYKIIDARGEFVSPGRHCQYSSAQECYDRTMGRQGGMSYVEITRSGTLGERVDMQYLFGHLDKITYGSDSLFFLPVWVFVLLALSLFLPLQRLTVLLSVMTVLTGLIACGHAAGLFGFLYRHVLLFTYFRNFFFFGAFFIPILILLAVVQLQALIGVKPADGRSKKWAVGGIIALHVGFFWFLMHFQGVPAVSWITLGLSAVVFVFYYAGGFRFPLRLWTGAFTVLLVIQPAWIMRAYALNAIEFKYVLPSAHVTPVFGWVRPDKPKVDSNRIYQFGHYEGFWYDMNMTDAPANVGFSESVPRFTFDLSEHTPADVLSQYARYKIVLYDDLNSAGEAVSESSPQLDVIHFDVNTLRLKTDFSRPKILVYNDSYTASWKAYLDGMPVELLRANGAFKGVRVPEGPHTVEFTYRPPGGAWVYITATIALFTFMIGTMFMLYWGL